MRAQMSLCDLLRLVLAASRTIHSKQNEQIERGCGKLDDRLIRTYGSCASGRARVTLYHKKPEIALWLHSSREMSVVRFIRDPRCLCCCLLCKQFLRSLDENDRIGTQCLMHKREARPVRRGNFRVRYAEHIMLSGAPPNTPSNTILFAKPLQSLQCNSACTTSRLHDQTLHFPKAKVSKVQRMTVAQNAPTWRIFSPARFVRKTEAEVSRSVVPRAIGRQYQTLLFKCHITSGKCGVPANEGRKFNRR